MTSFHDLLCCPSCRGALSISPQSLDCPTCDTRYPVVDDIPILIRGMTPENLESRFTRYWDSTAKADLYDRKVEGGDDPFGVYNHESELYGITALCRADNLDLVLDAGCGNGRFMAGLGPESLAVGCDASLNLLRIARAKGRGAFHVCCELEHLPFRNDAFGSVISCRVLQHLVEQERAVSEMARVVRPKGDLILQVYNTWNLKTIYKNIRMSPMRKVFNWPFRKLFRSMSPFDDWGLDYDRYNSWVELSRWMGRSGLQRLSGRGVGFGYHKYFFQPFFIDAVLRNHAPNFLKGYYRFCAALERRIGSLPPFRYLLEKIAIRGSKP
ncbi:MAG: methyltransferase domain-containing protein [Magnetococcales bacterium]|nr:methyltransferase domain-containing protein [Magnetococcales bacterium]